VPIPDSDLQQIRRWAQAKTPPKLLAEMRLDVEVVGSTVTIFDCRAPWLPNGEPAWDKQDVARLRWTAKYGTWSLYWADRDSKWHIYDLVPPTARIGTHLA
jgi:hypothetical protein